MSYLARRACVHVARLLCWERSLGRSVGRFCRSRTFTVLINFKRSQPSVRNVFCLMGRSDSKWTASKKGFCFQNVQLILYHILKKTSFLFSMSCTTHINERPRASCCAWWCYIHPSYAGSKKIIFHGSKVQNGRKINEALTNKKSLYLKLFLLLFISSTRWTQNTFWEG